MSDSILEQLNKPSLTTTHAATLEEEVEEGGQGEGREELYEPSPFSTKREMYSGKAQASAHTHTHTHWFCPLSLAAPKLQSVQSKTVQVVLPL